MALTKKELEKLKKIILEHYLQPKSIRILSEREVEELLNKYNISKLQLPKILNTDPIVKIIGAKEGDVIEFVRESPTAGLYKYYRVVVPSIEKNAE